MKLLVIGCGQCGGRIADEFARLNVRARVQRGIDIVSESLAVNTDIADLSGLSYLKSDYQHRILIGGQKTGGHGVGKINELGAEVATHRRLAPQPGEGGQGGQRHSTRPGPGGSAQRAGDDNQNVFWTERVSLRRQIIKDQLGCQTDAADGLDITIT